MTLYNEDYKQCSCFWGDKPANFVQKALHLVKSEHKQKSLRAIDLGCGEGKNLAFLASNGFNCLGFDVSPDAINNAYQNFGNSGAIFINLDFTKLDLANEIFDVSLATGSFHCLPDEDSILKAVEQLKAATTKDGYIVFSAFNDTDHDNSGHGEKFNPTLLPHLEYIKAFEDCEVIEESNKILQDNHPTNNYSSLSQHHKNASPQETEHVMSIFLHFLNRELHRSLGRDVLPYSRIEKLLKIVTLCTDEYLISNFANIIESNFWLRSPLLRELYTYGILKLHGEKNSSEEFWVSSRLRYKHDKERYRYVGKPDQSLLQIQPYAVREFSMTNKLKMGLHKYTYANDNPLSQTLSKLSQHSGHEGITMSLAARYLKGTSDQEVANIRLTQIGQVLSEQYLYTILEATEAEIITGIPGLAKFDHFSSSFPKNDARMMFSVLQALKIDLEELDIRSILKCRFSYQHSSFVSRINSTLRALHEPIVNKPHVLPNVEKIKRLLFAASRSLPDRAATSFGEINLNLHLLIIALRRSNPTFGHSFDYMNSDKPPILILTATNRESKAIIQAAELRYGFERQIQRFGSAMSSLIGIEGETQLFHTQCEAGSVGSAGSLAVAMDVLATMNPQMVIMPGICFGLQQKDQKIGDILVATHIHSYEKERTGDTKIPRGDKVPASALLVSALRTINQTWDKPKLHFGTILSGEKLVDNYQFTKRLLDIDIEAIGGEMEGAGLYSAAVRKQVDWILFKSIVDWGYKKSDEHQIRGAEDTTKLLFELIKTIVKST